MKPRKTFGTILLGTGYTDQPAWIISCEPHVRIRMKRVFEQICKGATDTLQLSDTPSNAAELLWFIARYPMAVPERKYLLARARKHRETSTAIERVMASDYVPSEFKMALPPRDYQRVAADLAMRTGRLLLADDLGLGKQQPVDTKVLTPDGYREMGALCVGDRVIGSNGKAISVVGVFPQGVKPSYRLTFNDGSSVEAGPEHLWTFAYYIGGRRLHRITVTTDQVRTGDQIETTWDNGCTTRLTLGRATLYLPMLEGPVEFESRAALPIAPYLMGQLIANGALSQHSHAATVHAQDWPAVRARLLADSCQIGAVQTYGNAVRFGTPGIAAQVRSLGLDVLSGDKRIPLTYLNAAAVDRVALLHGLMDGDGSISAIGNKVTYHTINKPLAGDVRELVECLGGVASVREYQRTDGKSTEYQVRVRLPESIAPFTVPRKARRYAPAQRKAPTRSLVKIEYVRDVESVCIRVDAADRLYATEHAILTHNTASAICTLTDPENLPALVVTMSHLPLQWESELHRFLPGLRTHKLKKGSPYDLGNKANGLQLPFPGAIGATFPDVVISNYHKLGGWSEVLAGRIKTVIFDECQELRIPDSVKYSAARKIAREAKLRIGLSATPVYNMGGEIHAVMEVLAPDHLGSRAEFNREWCNGYSPDNTRAGAVTDPKALGTYLREQGLMLRRTRAEVGRELPPLQRVLHAIDCDEKEIEKVGSSVAELARIILRQGGADPFQKMRAAEEFTNQLRQATGIAKAPYVAAFVKMLAESGEPIVLAGWHRTVYEIWLDQLKDLNPVMYTGTESPTAKEKAKQAFVTGESKLLIMSLRSGAGLDGLQGHCRTVVIGELDWSPKVHDQLIGRVHRDGQDEPCVAYFPVANSGSDPVVVDVLGLKAAQARGINDPDAPLVVEETSDPNRVKRMAEDFLRQRGEHVDLQETTEAA